MQTIFKKHSCSAGLLFLFFFSFVSRDISPAFGQDMKVLPRLAQDTAAISNDSVKNGPVNKKNDSLSLLLKDTSVRTGPTQAAQVPAIAPADTASLFLKIPYFTFGFGWDLGSFPLFSEWKNGLPDSAQDIVKKSIDTLSYSVREPVDPYNITFPITVSYTPFVFSKSSLGFECSFFYLGKSLLATLQSDTPAGKIDYSLTMNCWGVTAGVLYRHGIDERYFSIDKVDRTSFLLGLGAIPYLRINKNGSLSSSGLPDSVVSAAQATLQNFSAHGMGLIWRVGITAQRALSRGSGMEVSISYVGRYVGYFKKGNAALINRDINALSSDPEGKFSIFSNMLEIRLEFLIGRIPSKRPSSVH
jgi:hypothetical protein